MFFILFSCKNENNTIETKDEAVVKSDYSAGKNIYTDHCSLCHQENGEGIPGAFPELINKKADINSVVNGVKGTVMVAFKDSLSDQKIADVINYINHSWGNEYDEIDEEMISEFK